MILKACLPKVMVTVNYKYTKHLIVFSFCNIMFVSLFLCIQSAQCTKVLACTYDEPTRHPYHFFFEEEPPGVEPGRRLYFRGSFRLINTLLRVPFPPSQNPLPAFPMRTARQTPQFSGRYICSLEQKPQIIRFACSFGWSVSAS